jgi:hypothetical protein
MRFKFPRREFLIGKLNLRAELHGDEHVPAVDIPVECDGTKRDLDMLVRAQEGKFSDMIYGENGVLLVPDISPLRLSRKPENLQVIIHDQLTARGKSLTFESCKAKDIEVILGPKHKLKITFKLQLNIDPDRDSARLVRIMGEKREMEIVATQDDLFDTDEKDEDDDAPEQGELVGEQEEE